MEFQRLPHASALVSGAHLWAIPDLKCSTWAQLIDWYLNLQISKTRLHKAASFSPELEKIIENTGSGTVQIKVSDSAPLLLSTAQFVPAQIVSMIPFEGEAEKWLEKVELIWKKLNKPSIRIFLPKGTTDESIFSSWKSEDDSIKTYVSEAQN